MSGLLLAALLGSAHADDADGAVVIASKNFTESRLLAELMGQLIAARTGLEVEVKAGLGGTTVVFTALTTGEIDLYPEYTGTGWSVHLKIDRPVRDPLEAYVTVSRRFAEEHDLVWLPPFGFNNTYAIAMREDRAAELGVTRISELAPHAGELVAGVSHEFLNREDGWPGLEDAYGLEIGELRGMEHGLAYEAIASGAIDLVDAYSTDGKLMKFDVRILEDDRRFFPPYDAAPLVRADLLQRHPEVAEVLGELAFRIPDARMQQLNGEVEVDGRSFEAVARDFLVEEGLIGADAAAASGPGRAQDSFLAFMAARSGQLAALAGEHLGLTLISVLLAVAASVPAGVAVTRRAGLRWLLTAAGVLQTVPSLALLALMIPVLGLGVSSAITALFLYAILPVLRNTVTGIEEVDPDLVEAAVAMGLTDRQLLTRVQLPLASPTIMAGIRTATVISVGVATLAAFIGAGGLGEPIVTGLQLNDTRLILSGAIPAAALAVLVDFGLGRLERAITPRGL